MHVHNFTTVNNNHVQLVPRYHNARWAPVVRRWRSSAALAGYLANLLVQSELKLVVLMEPFAPFNIGHALFDGLYPIYVSMLKLGLERGHKSVVPIVSNLWASERRRQLHVGDRITFFHQNRLSTAAVTDLGSWGNASTVAKKCSFRNWL